ncbi:MAG: hypothetical protein ACK4M7_02925 [Burkholderiales bacterium]
MKVNVILLLGLIGGLIAACSKSPTLSCDSENAQAALLSTGKPDSSSPIYFRQQLANFAIIKTTSKDMLCKADLTLSSNLDSSNQITIPLQYVVSAPQNRLLNISILNKDGSNQAKQREWLAKLTKQTKSITDYKLTPYGALYVVESDEQTLYFNGKIVAPKIENYQVSIENNFKLGDAYVFLIGSYTGGSIDNDTPNNTLVQVANKDEVTISQAFAYQSNGIKQEDNRLLINGVAIGRPYAEDRDFPIYTYESGVLTTLRDVKPDSYYQAKLADLQPQDIINQAKADNCLDAEQEQLDLSHRCYYGAKYCFEFKAMKHPQHDEYYVMLAKSCNN